MAPRLIREHSSSNADAYCVFRNTGNHPVLIRTKFANYSSTIRYIHLGDMTRSLKATVPHTSSKYQPKALTLVSNLRSNMRTNSPVQLLKVQLQTPVSLWVNNFSFSSFSEGRNTLYLLTNFCLPRFPKALSIAKCITARHASNQIDVTTNVVRSLTSTHKLLSSEVSQGIDC